MITTETIPTGKEFESLGDDVQYALARRMQWLLREDFLSLPGVHSEDIVSVADPANDALVERQIGKLLHPAQDTYYAWLHNNDGLTRSERTGFVKVGPHTRGDQAPYGRLPSYVYELCRRVGFYPEAVGLHAFALESRSRHLATAALRAVYSNDEMVPVTHELRASVDVCDRGLNQAFDVFGASRSRDDAPIVLGSAMTRRYVQRVLPPKDPNA